MIPYAAISQSSMMEYLECKIDILNSENRGYCEYSQIHCKFMDIAHFLPTLVCNRYRMSQKQVVVLTLCRLQCTATEQESPQAIDNHR